VWPDLCVVAFLVGSENLTMQGIYWWHQMMGLSVASNDGPVAYDRSPPAQQTPWDWMQWVPRGLRLRLGPQQQPHICLGMPQASGWVSWPQQPPMRSLSPHDQ
jgi:hypothetical protein